MADPSTKPAPSGGHDVEVAPVRPGEELDWPRLEGYLRDQIPELSGDFDVLQFPNGSANLTYLVRFGDQKLVVRRPPFGQLAPGAHDMRREFRAVDALSKHFDRAPRGYLFCDDHDVIGSDFLVVEYRSGVVVWDHIPESMADAPDAARRIGFAVVDALADLHLLDPGSIGLGDLGKPTGFVERQVTGWRKRWDLVDTGRVPQMTAVAAQLLATMPSVASGVSVLHNDYKIDNCQFAAGDPGRVTSIFDWDMATIGEPLVDVGILLNYWPDPADVEGRRPLHVPGLEQLGLPTRAEVVARYGERTGTDVSAVAWFEAFATWKTCVVLEQLYQRFVRGESTDPRMGERGKPVAPLADRAAELLARLPS
ncbi:MAG: phosphotransferase family protein [Ilumatobacteraceae bacterium]